MIHGQHIAAALVRLPHRLSIAIKRLIGSLTAHDDHIPSASL